MTLQMYIIKWEQQKMPGEFGHNAFYRATAGNDLKQLSNALF